MQEHLSIHYYTRDSGMQGRGYFTWFLMLLAFAMMVSVVYLERNRIKEFFEKAKLSAARLKVAPR